MKKKALILFVVMVLFASLACGIAGGRNQPAGDDTGAAAQDTGGDETQAPEQDTQQDSGAAQGDYKFPITKDADTITEIGEDGLNYQTGMSLDEVIEFYRDELVNKQGLVERELLTATTETTFSMVFDGDPSGLAVVVQGVDLGGGKTNVNIRLEDV